MGYAIVLGDKDFSALNLGKVHLPEPDYVDLGLPSGLLWCKHNVGATNPEDYGDYFAWGETTGYADAAARNAALGRNDGFSSEAYAATGASDISANLTLAQDAARVNMGGSWRMPTREEYNELISNTDREWTTLNGVAGMKFMKKSDNSVFIFFPAAGRINGTNLGVQTTNGLYCTASFYDDSYAWSMGIYSGGATTSKDYEWRSYGRPVRGVKD